MYIWFFAYPFTFSSEIYLSVLKSTLLLDHMKCTCDASCDLNKRSVFQSM